MSFTDRYELVVPLGRHPGGALWRAKRKEDDRPVALAIADGQGLMDEGLFEQLRKRFRHDFDALKRAKRGHLPTVLDVGEDDAANPYAAMDLVEGDALELDDDLSVEAIGTIFDGVLRALEAAHRVQVFHGDIEPGNVLVAEDGTATLVGFGLNRALAGAEGWNDDDEDHLRRSALHRAPELGAGELPGDPRADLYGVGVMLHVALGGEPPKPGRSVAAVAPELGASLVKLIDRAVEPSPQGRYASAWAMRTALSGAVRMAAKGEKPPSGKQTMAGGLKAPNAPSVPKVPAAAPATPARRPSAPPPPSKVKPSRPPPAKTKRSQPPPAPSAKAKGTKPPPAPTASKRKGPKTKPFPITEAQGETAKASVPPPAPERKKGSKGERPKTVPFEIPKDAGPEKEAIVRAATDSGAGAQSSIPPPVVGVGVAARAEEGRDSTQSISLEDVEVVGSGTPAKDTPKTVPPPTPATAADPMPAADDEDVPLPVVPSMVRSPLALAAVAVVALGLGWVIGRVTAPEPMVDLDEIAAAPAPAEETDEAEAAPEPTPEASAAEPSAAEPTEPEPAPLRLGEVPEGVEARLGDGPYDPDAPPMLAPDGAPVPVEVARGEQRIRLSLARDEAGGLALTVDEVSEPPEPEPAVAPSPMTRRSRRARRRRSAMRSGSATGGSLMRPGIAYDPGF